MKNSELYLESEASVFSFEENNQFVVKNILLDSPPTPDFVAGSLSEATRRLIESQSNGGLGLPSSSTSSIFSFSAAPA